MADRTAKLRLGGFVAAALAALTGLTVLFGGAPQVFSNRARYLVTFGEAPGVGPGIPVRKSGVRIGEVSALDLDPDTGQVRVTVQVDKKYLPRTNEDATIFRGLLSGDTSVDFVPKTGPDGQPVSTRGDVIPPDSEIQGVTPINPNQLVRQASGVLPTAQESMARILASVERFERAVPRVEKAFDEMGALARSGREFVPEMRRTNEKVQELLAFADDPRDPQGQQVTLKQTLAEVRDFLRTARPLVEDLRRIVRENEKDIGGTMRAIRGTAEGLSDILNPDNRKVIAELLKNVQAASGDLPRVVQLLAGVLGEGDKVVRQFNARLAQLEGVLKSADTAFRGIESAIQGFGAVGGAGGAFGSINSAAGQLEKTLIDVRELLRVVGRADGTLQKVIYDPSLYNNLNDAAVSLSRTLMRAEKAAADLQVFADKIARRPEVIGVGGAVRPSAGLKESPAAPLPGGPIAPTPIHPVGQVVPSYRIPQPPAGSASPPSDLPPK